MNKEQLARYIERMKAAGLYVQTAEVTEAEIEARRKAMQKSVVMVDYLKLMK